MNFLTKKEVGRFSRGGREISKIGRKWIFGSGGYFLYGLTMKQRQPKTCTKDPWMERHL